MPGNSFVAGKSIVVAGLGTFYHTIVTPANYNIQVNSNVPNIPPGSSNPSSSLLITIQRNGSTVVSNGGASNNPNPYQEVVTANANMACAVNDVISVILSSSNPADNTPNAVKSQIFFRQGI